MREPLISKSIRVRHPEHFSIGPFSIVDDFCYFSTRIQVAECCHIASGCSIAGGVDRLFSMGSYSSLSSGVKIWCTSDDFVNDLIAILPEELTGIKAHSITGDVILEAMTGVGANSVVMPDNNIPEGAAIGALSFVPPRFKFEPWKVYAGIPIKMVGARNQYSVMKQVEALKARLDDLRA